MTFGSEWELVKVFVDENSKDYSLSGDNALPKNLYTKKDD